MWHEIRADLEPIVAAAYRGDPVQMDDPSISARVSTRGTGRAWNRPFLWCSPPMPAARSRTNILDIGLPDMTGYELAGKLRGLGLERQPVFIALTGYGQEHDRAKSRLAGFNHHLVKPADIQKLLQIMH